MGPGVGPCVSFTVVSLDGAGVVETLGAGDGEDGAINIGKKTAAEGCGPNTTSTAASKVTLNRNVVPGA
tara:strand:+ start:140 stop:346 length:207 start_codon:yes stop_codon:yes gene_type:complete